MSDDGHPDLMHELIRASLVREEIRLGREYVAALRAARALRERIHGDPPPDPAALAELHAAHVAAKARLRDAFDGWIYADFLPSEP